MDDKAAENIKDDLVQEFIQSLPTHPNLSRIWLHHLLVSPTRQANFIQQQAKQAKQALQLFQQYPDLSVGHIALLMFVLHNTLLDEL